MTALVGGPLILGLLFGFGVEGVTLFAWVISLGMWFEFAKMFFNLPDKNEKTAIFLVFTTVIHWGHYWLTVGIHPAFLGLAPVFLFAAVFLFQVPRLLHYKGSAELNNPEGVARLKQHLFELMAACFGVVYCTWFPLLMVNIREADRGQHWLAFTLLTVWSADSFAYFAGVKFGKSKLFESVSPKKSWEGLIGGAIGAVVVTQIYSHFLIPGIARGTLIVMCLALTFASVVGDLVESLMKRATECKDSGSLLPGHGGFLDRFDGVIFALPVMYLFLWTII
ncbi:MAG: phosphatidate cytidylyltransferase [Bdellovibrionales bacterium]|nr:phosphatidate cytidylyltransferase [Bdellovibrionales bacterium]